MLQASGAGMPSSRYIDLTLGASGSTYTAPANGWFAICAWNSVANGIVAFYNQNNFTSPSARNAWAGGNIHNNLPCKKGDVITLGYDGISLTNADNYFRFYYAEGSK